MPTTDQNKSISDLEEETFDVDDTAEVPPNDIIAYNELRSCADLYRMYTQGILDISPDFQRDEVWKPADQSRFIDSLIKGLPIPSMCFAFDQKKNRWVVIDGLQRISTIVKFLEGGDWKISKLDDIDPEIAGKSVAAIKTSEGSLGEYYGRVENLSIPVTVLRCDFSKTQHMEYLFTIFHRLNTGGMKLNNQEIRNCIYSGEFNKLLHTLDKGLSWRRLNKMAPDAKYRYTKQEIMLRFFAFHEMYETYQGGLAKFLNTYMHKHRHPSEAFLTEKNDLFSRTITTLYEKVFEKKPPKLSISIFEALLVGVGRNLEVCETQTSEDLKEKYQRMQDHESFSERVLREGLSGKKRVRDRLDAAVDIFS